MSVPVIYVQNLTHIFKDFWGRPTAYALTDLSFSIRQGEAIGLLGPNGAGKSTALNLILGLMRPTSGQIGLFGQSPETLAVKKRIGFVPEDTPFYPWLTATETLCFTGGLFRIPKAECRQRTTELLDCMGLSSAANRPLSDFSKGMLRRTAIAQALIHNPDLLILDEPTSGLDPVGIRETGDLLSELKKQGKTLLITGHHLSEMESLCDRILILCGGRCCAEGKLSDLLADSEKTLITLPRLSVAEERKVRESLQREVPDTNPEFGHPTRTLESLFLSVIAGMQAKKNGDGAHCGGKIPDFLKGKR